MKAKIWLALPAALALIAFVAVAVGCASDDKANTSSTSGNATDAAFVIDLTAHHDGAIDMARIAQKRAEHPEIRALAADIVAAQAGEIAVMKTIRRSMHGMEEHNGHMGMSDAEMGMDMDPAELEERQAVRPRVHRRDGLPSRGRCSDGEGAAQERRAAGAAKDGAGHHRRPGRRNRALAEGMVRTAGTPSMKP